MSGIFLSYRRDDTSTFSRTLATLLVRSLGRQNVFIDIETIQGGQNFPLELDRALAVADVVLVIIGPKWATITNVAGVRRLDDPADFVRREVETTLQRNTTLIPILVGGATMPQADELPPSLRPLTALTPHSMRDVDDKPALRQVMKLARQHYWRSEITRQPRIAFPLLAALESFLVVGYVPNLIISVAHLESVTGAAGFNGVYTFLFAISLVLTIVRMLQNQFFAWFSFLLGSIILLSSIAVLNEAYNRVIPSVWGPSLYLVCYIVMLPFSIVGPTLWLRWRASR